MSNRPTPAGGIRVTHDVDRATVGQQVIEFGPIGEFVDPRQVDQEQPARIVGRGIEAIEVHRLPPVVGAHAHEVALVTHHVDQLELLEHGGDGRKTLADLRPRLDGDAQRRRIVENEAQERVSDRPFGKIGHVEIEGFQVRQLHLALLVTHGEIVSAAIVEVADAGEAHAVAIDHRPRHYRDFRPPVAIVRGRMETHHRDHAEKQHDRRPRTCCRRRENQSAQIANAAKATASARRTSAHGRFE